MWFVTVSPITNVGVNSLVVAPTSNTFLSQTFLNKGEATSHTSSLKGKLTICKLLKEGCYMDKHIWAL